MQGHMLLFANKFLEKQDRFMQMVSLCPGRDWIDMHNDASDTDVSVRSRDLGPPEVKICPCPFWINRYMSQWGSTREARWCSLCCSNGLRSKVILEKAIWLFEVIGLTSQVDSCSKILNFIPSALPRQEKHARFFSQSSSSIRGQTTEGYNRSPSYTFEREKPHLGEDIKIHNIVRLTKYQMTQQKLWKSYETKISKG